MGQRQALLERCLPSNTKSKSVPDLLEMSLRALLLYLVFKPTFACMWSENTRANMWKRRIKSNESWHYQTIDLTQIIKWVGFLIALICLYHQTGWKTTVFLQVMQCQFDYCSILGEQEHAAGVLHGTRGEFWHWEKNEYISSHFAKVADRFGTW